MPTKNELVERIQDLEGENEELQGQLDEILDIVVPPEEDEKDESADEDEDNLGEE